MQVQVLAKDVVSPPEHTDGAESDEVNASLQALDRSLRQVRDHFLLFLLFLLFFCCASFCVAIDWPRMITRLRSSFALLIIFKTDSIALSGTRAFGLCSIQKRHNIQETTWPPCRCV